MNFYIFLVNIIFLQHFFSISGGGDIPCVPPLSAPMIYMHFSPVFGLDSFCLLHIRGLCNNCLFDWFLHSTTISYNYFTQIIKSQIFFLFVFDSLLEGLKADASDALMQIANLSLAWASIYHSVNWIFYFWRIKAFRDSLVAMLRRPCGVVCLQQELSNDMKKASRRNTKN